MRRVHGNSITGGVIWSSMLAYFFTLLLGAFFQQFYNTIDAVIVGRGAGSDALAAVGGSAATVVNLFVGFFLGLSSGATVVIAQFFGAARRQEVKRAVHTAMAMAVIGGLIITVIGVIIAPWLIETMQTPKAIAGASVLYLRIYFVGMIPNLVYNMGAGILRAVGDSRRPLYVLIVSCFANIILDIFFVITLGMGKGGTESGTVGVAVATVLCQLLSAIMVVVILAKENTDYRLIFKEIRLDMEMLARIVKIGIPAALQSSMYTLSNILIQTSINGFGKETTAAWAAYGKVDVLFWMTISSIGTTVTTFVGQNFGAGKLPRVKSSIRYAFAMAIVITIPLSTLLVMFSDFMLKIFVTDSEVIQIGVQMIEYLAPFYITYICVEIFSGALRGLGDALVPMLITLSGICLLRVAWILFYFPTHRTVTVIEQSYPVTWITTSVLFIAYYFFRIKRVFH